MKTCTKCHIERPANEFFERRKRGKHGQIWVSLHSHCKHCQRSRARQRIALVPIETRRARVYASRTRRFGTSSGSVADRIKNGGRSAQQWAQARADIAQMRSFLRTIRGIARWKAAARTLDPEVRRQRLNARCRSYYKNDPRYALRHRVKRWMQKHLKERPHGRSKKWAAILGYTPQQLARHLEAQFKPGMSWKNMGAWHIDHKRPVASFVFTSPDDEEFKLCFALSNLQPLWAAENNAKRAQWDGERGATPMPPGPRSAGVPRG